MAGHKRGKARADRHQKAAASKESDAVQQPGPSNAAQQLGPSNATQQPRPSIAIQQPGPSGAAQQPGLSNATQQPEPSIAIQQPGPSGAVQQPGPSTLIQQSDARNAAQRGVTGVEEEDTTEQIANVKEPRPDEQGLRTLPEEQLGDGETGLTQQESAATEDKEEGEAVPADIVSTGDDHAGPSERSEQSRHGNVNPMMAEREIKKKRRGRHL